jgi:hypothetical protein
MEKRKSLKDRREAMTKNYDIPIEAFEHRYFWLFEKLEHYEELDANRVFIFLNDGTTLMYDNLVHTYYNVKIFNSVGELSNEEWKKGFSHLLRANIRRSGLPQYILAEKIGITKSMLNNYVAGKSIPSSNILNYLAEELNCSADDLFPKKYIILD